MSLHKPELNIWPWKLYSKVELQRATLVLADPLIVSASIKTLQDQMSLPVGRSFI